MRVHDERSTADLFHVASGAHAAVLLPSIFIWRAIAALAGERLHQGFSKTALGNGPSLLKRRLIAL